MTIKQFFYDSRELVRYWRWHYRYGKVLDNYIRTMSPFVVPLDRYPEVEDFSGWRQWLAPWWFFRHHRRNQHHRICHLFGGKIYCYCTASAMDRLLQRCHCPVDRNLWDNAVAYFKHDQLRHPPY